MSKFTCIFNLYYWFVGAALEATATGADFRPDTTQDTLK